MCAKCPWLSATDIAFVFWLCSVDVSCWSSVLCCLLWKSFHVDEHQEFHQIFFCFPIALKASLLLMCIQMSESFHDLSYICLFILGIQNLCRKAFGSIFTKDLVFELDVKHVFHGVEFVWILNLQVDKVGWTNQTIPCFLLSSLTWIQSWIASLYSGWCRIWRYHCRRLKQKKVWCACFIKLRQSLVSRCDNFVHFKVTCKGLHKFGITKKLCDNTFR